MNPRRDIPVWEKMIIWSQTWKKKFFYITCQTYSWNPKFKNLIIVFKHFRNVRFFFFSFSAYLFWLFWINDHSQWWSSQSLPLLLLFQCFYYFDTKMRFWKRKVEETINFRLLPALINFCSVIFKSGQLTLNFLW